MGGQGAFDAYFSYTGNDDKGLYTHPSVKMLHCNYCLVEMGSG